MLSFRSYRRFVVIPQSGRRVLLRFLTNDDQVDLLKMYNEAPTEDILFLKQDIKDRNLIKDWLKNINYDHVFPLLAINMDDNRMVGEAHMERGQGSFKHVAEIQQIFVSRPLQGQGLGSLLIEQLMELAQQENLHWLKTEVVTEHKCALRALLNKGFKIKANLEEFFLGKNGLKYDLALLTCPVLSESEDF